MTETTRQALFTQAKRLREAANRIEAYAAGYATPDSKILIAESELIAHIASEVFGVVVDRPVTQ